MVDHRLLTIREASEWLGLRESTLRKWVLEKRISYHKVGRSVRLSSDEVEDLIRQSYRPQLPVGE